MRMRLFWVAGFIFRRRQKARILFLYNFLLHERAQYEQLARARIRYQVRKRLLRQTTEYVIILINLFYNVSTVHTGYLRTILLEQPDVGLVRDLFQSYWQRLV